MTTPRNPFISGFFYGVDANGVPLSGGKLYTYVAESTTPQATYPGPSDVSANANPVILNASGMANVWLPAGLSYRFDLYDASNNLIWTRDDWLSPAASSGDGVADTSGAQPGGRLTLDNGITNSDISSAVTVRYMPYQSDKVPLYDGTSWALYSIGTGISQATTDNTKSPAAVANNKNYDMFAWNDSGTVRLSRGPAWSSDTSRGAGAGTTELDILNGRYINKNSITNGPAAQLGLYVGTIRSDGSAHINDNGALRHVWNAYHRFMKYMQAIDATATWAYTTATWRQANANAANQLDFVLGLGEDSVTAQVQAAANNSSAAPAAAVAIGVDSTSSPTGLRTPVALDVGYNTLTAIYDAPLGVGRHYLAWLEYSGATGTTTWTGTTPGPLITVSGITGRLFC